ncbi:MAG: metal-dependent hydrolase [bacterium]|nr:metal-dependent hydrolase [bacterium]
MNPASHFLISWTVANTAEISRRDRVLVTLTGVVPDFDGVGIIAELLTENTATPLIWYSKYHHILGHNLLFSLFLTIGVFLLSVGRWISAALAFLAFHLHLLGDLVGSRGPDGYQWPIPYLYPFSAKWTLAWPGQWELNAWPNILITTLVLGITLYLAWKRGRSPLEMVSLKADAAFVTGLRKRFGNPLSAIARKMR